MIVTDSGGLQKEAYWYGVPCVTTRPSTEWVDTVEPGANVLVDDDPDRLVEAVAKPRMPAERPQLYGDGHAAGASRPLCTLPGRNEHGRPLRHRRDRRRLRRHAACAGLRRGGQEGRARRRRSQRRRRRDQPRREPHRGRPLRAAEAARRVGGDRRDDRLLRRRRSRRDRDRGPDAALDPARAGPLLHRERRPLDRAAPARGPPRRARVDHLSGDDPRRAQAAARGGKRAEGRRGLPPRLRPRARRSRPRRTSRRGRPRRSSAASTSASTEAAAAPLPGRRRRGAPGLDRGGGRAVEAAREHLPLGEHRARQRARAALRPDGDRRLGGRGRRRDQAVRVHVVQARAGPRRPLHPARPVLPLVEGARVRLHDALRRARGRDQQQHAVLLPVGDLAGAEPRRAEVADAARRSCSWASPTRRTSTTSASRRPRRCSMLLRNAGAEVSYHDPHVRRVRRAQRPCRSSRSATTAS